MLTYWNPSVIYSRLTRSFLTALAETAGVAIKTAPRRTGELSRSIVPVPMGPFSGGILARAKHAASQEFGSRPHVIAPRPGGYLASTAPQRASTSGLRTQRAEFGPLSGPVNHPGTRPTYFMHKAAMAFPELFVAAARKAFLSL